MKLPDQKLPLYQKLLLHAKELERLGFPVFVLQFTERDGAAWQVTKDSGHEPKVEYLGKPSTDKTVLT